jgi:hypothetical protein
VPFIIIDPSESIIHTDRAMQLIDVFPTVCDLLKLPYLDNFQGNSMLVDSDTETVFPLDLAVSYYRNNGKKGYSFRSNDLRYTLWTNHNPIDDDYNDISIDFEEFYQYSEDIQAVEKVNVVDDVMYSERLTEMKIKVEKWWTAYRNNHKNVSTEIVSVVEDNTLANSIDLFPNPTSSITTVVGKNINIKNIKLYNSTGDEVTIHTSMQQKSQDTVEIDLSNIVAGQYIIEIFTHRQILIKQ